MTKILYCLLVAFCFTQAAYAQTSTFLPQYQVTNGVNQSVSAATPLPVGVYDAGNHSGYCYTSNGSGAPATFQSCGSGTSAAIGSSVGGGTQNSVLFLGASGVLAQDNAKFNWNDANGILSLGGTTGIGNTTNFPGTVLALTGAAASGGYIQANCQDTTASGQCGYTATANDGTDLTHYAGFYMNNGTSPSPTNTFFTNVHAASLYTTDNELDIGALGATGAINFYTNGYTTPQMTIGATGAVAVGNSVAINGATLNSGNVLAWNGGSNSLVTAAQPSDGLVHSYDVNFGLFTATGTISGGAAVTGYDVAQIQGSGQTSNGAHIVGHKAEAIFNGTGMALAKAIGTEGALSSIVTATGTLADGRVVDSLYYNSATGVNTTLLSFYAVDSFSLFNGTYGTVAGLYIPTISFGAATVGSAYSVYSSGSNLKMYNQGSVGIGNASPASALDVYGTISLTGTAFANPITTDSVAGGSISIGVNSLTSQNALASTAFRNTGVGYSVMGLGTLTTAAVRNTGVGYEALANLTSGTKNNAFGVFAAFSNTTGVQNNAFGQGALQNNFTGSGNTAMGDGAGSIITGNNNTVVGLSAGQHITGGTSNTVIGANVGTLTLTTGTGNILLGTTNATDTASATSSNEVNIGGLLFYNTNSAAAPVVSACGTTPSIDAHANNRSGTVTVGTVAAASCTITFAGTGYSTWNHCRVTSQSTIASMAYSYTLTVLTVTGTSLVSDKLDYDCDGY